MKEQLIKEIKAAMSSIGAGASEQTGYAEPNLDYPENPDHGDFSTNVAMINAKKLGLAPKVLAEKIVAEFKKKMPDYLKDVSVAGPGFVNFRLTEQAVSSNTKNIIDTGDGFGKQKIGIGQTVLVEYSSPNIAKPFTVGHLRSTIIGDSIANILDALGYKIIRDNHLGDWGTQFGKLLIAIDKWGNFEEIQKSKEPIKELVDLYVKFHDEVDRLKKEVSEAAAVELEESARARFQVLESDILKGDDDSLIVKKWKACIELSKKEFINIYSKLDVTFDPKRGDTELGESFYIDKSKPAIDQLKSKDLLKESEGAQVVFFEGEKYPPLIVEKSNGASIYATRDLAADWYRKQTYGEGLKIVNEVGSEQILYFRQLFETERMLGWYSEGERIHVAHGLYRFKDGKMSTRKGNVIWLTDIIEEAEARAAKINEESAHDVAIAALKFNDLKRDPVQDIVFDWDEMMSMSGDSGPYLQYSCVRAKAVVEKARGLNIVGSLDSARPNIESLDKLERYLVRFPGVIAFAGEVYKPNVIANYLIGLASHFNSFYAQTPIVDANDKSSAYKVAVTEAFIIVISKGLSLLGIRVPKKM